MTYSVNDYLDVYKKEGTKNVYRSSLLSFFKTIYEDVNSENLNEKSLIYLAEERDFRKDVLGFRNVIKDKAPKTQASQLAAIVTFLGYNEIEFPKIFKKNLNGRFTEAISDEHVLNHEEI